MELQFKIIILYSKYNFQVCFHVISHKSNIYILVASNVGIFYNDETRLMRL